MVILSPVLGSSLTHAENGKNFSPSSIYGVTVPRDTKAEEALLVGKSSSSTVAEQPGDTDANDQEEVWVEISDAIEGLNDVVGDRMFLDLRRKNESEMEVRLDAGFWERVRYQTRVDLKNDISNIWHLYVRQYYDGGFSSVRFVDDETDKTIDIFSQAK
jgi:hypothetical protein